MAKSLLLPMLFASAMYGQTGSRTAVEISAARQQASIAVQRAALRNQAHAAPAAVADSFFVLEAAIPEAAACEPLPPGEIDPLIDRAARRERISPELIHAVIRQESAFRPCAVSAKGALGLMQLMPATAGDLGVYDPFDPGENVDGGARLLRQLMDRYTGDLNRVLGAYNAGPARVDAADGVPQIPETLHYVETILGNLRSRGVGPPLAPQF